MAFGESILSSVGGNTGVAFRAVGLMSLRGGDKVSRQLNTIGRKVDGFGAGMLKAGAIAAKGMALAGAAAVAAGGYAVKLAADFEQTRVGFTTLLKDGKKAEAFLKRLARFAKKTPFEVKDLEQISKKLLAYGFAAEEVIPVLRTVGDATSALGGGAEVLNRITIALGQMKAKGTIQAEEMRQLAEAGIPAWDILATTLGVTIPEAMKMVERRAVQSSEALPALFEGMNKRFGGGMEKQSKTLLGMWSNIKDSLTLIFRGIGTSLVDSMNLKGATSAIQNWLADVEKVVTGWGEKKGKKGRGENAMFPILRWLGISPDTQVRLYKWIEETRARFSKARTAMNGGSPEQRNRNANRNAQGRGAAAGPGSAAMGIGAFFGLEGQDLIDLGESVDRIFVSLQRAAANLKDVFGTWFDELVDFLSDPQNPENIIRVADAIGWLTERIANFTEAAKHLSDFLTGDFNTGLNTSNETVQTWGTNFRENWLAHLESATRAVQPFEDAINNINTAFQTGGTNFRTNWLRHLNQLEATRASWAATFRAKWAEAWKYIGDRVAAAGAYIQTKFNQVVAWFKNLGSQARSWGSTIGNNFTSGLRAGFIKAAETAFVWAQKVVNAVRRALGMKEKALRTLPATRYQYSGGAYSGDGPGMGPKIAPNTDVNASSAPALLPAITDAMKALAKQKFDEMMPHLFSPGGLKGGGSSKGLTANVVAALRLVSSMFGLRLTSGFRPGSITASGRRSLHGSGRAIDVVGSRSAKWAAFNYMSANGGKMGLYEAINEHTIWKPGRGKYHWARNDHMDHLHLGFAFGQGGVVRRPVMGLIGERRSARTGAYVPEVVQPLDKMSGGNIIIYADRYTDGRRVAKDVQQVVGGQVREGAWRSRMGMAGRSF